MTESTLTALDNFTGCYGQDWARGVLVDHVGDATQAGCLYHVSPRGWAFLTGPKGGAAEPVLCAEVIEIATEDGPMTGRCGRPVKADELGCPGHHEAIMSYRRGDA